VITEPVAVIIPTLNEEATIGGLCKYLYSNGYDVFVVDDNSKDKTSFNARANFATVIQNKERKGLAKSLWQGFHYILASNEQQYNWDKPYNYVVTIDAGASHNPEQILPMLQMAQNYDLVIGSRFLPFSQYDNSNGKWYRPTASKLAAKLCNLAQHGSKYSDWTSGFRIYRIDLIQALSKFYYTSKMHPIQIELLGRASSLGAGIFEYPISYVAGKTSFNSSVASEAFRVWLEVLNHYSPKPKVTSKVSLW